MGPSLGLGPRRLSLYCSQRPSAASREVQVSQKPGVVKNSSTVEEGAECKWARNYKQSTSNTAGFRPLRLTYAFDFGFGLPNKRKKETEKGEGKEKGGLGTSNTKVLLISYRHQSGGVCFVVAIKLLRAQALKALVCSSAQPHTRSFCRN